MHSQKKQNAKLLSVSLSHIHQFFFLIQHSLSLSIRRDTFSLFARYNYKKKTHHTTIDHPLEQVCFFFRPYENQGVNLPHPKRVASRIYPTWRTSRTINSSRSRTVHSGDSRDFPVGVFRTNASIVALGIPPQWYWTMRGPATPRTIGAS